MKRFPAFSLVEIAIGLFIVGLLLMAVMKGSKLVDTAKIQTCVQQIAEIKRDFETYIDGLGAADSVNLDDFSLPTERPKLGGVFKVEPKNDKHVVTLANQAGQGFLSPDQALGIQKYFPDAEITGCDTNGTAKTCHVQVPI